MNWSRQIQTWTRVCNQTRRMYTGTPKIGLLWISNWNVCVRCFCLIIALWLRMTELFQRHSVSSTRLKALFLFDWHEYFKLYVCFFLLLLSVEALGTIDWHRIRWKKNSGIICLCHIFGLRHGSRLVHEWNWSVENKNKRDSNCRYIKWYQCHFIFLHYVCHTLSKLAAAEDFSFLIDDSSICYYKTIK